MQELSDLLIQDLINNVNIDLGQAVEVVEFLVDNDFVDYDTLKEIYLYDDE